MPTSGKMDFKNAERFASENSNKLFFKYRFLDVSGQDIPRNDQYGIL